MKSSSSLILTIVSCVIVILLIVFGISREKSPTLLEVCWLQDGRAQYVHSDLEGQIPNPVCSDPEPIKWPSARIPVSIVSSDNDTLDGTGDERLVVDAMNAVNDNLGTGLRFTKQTESALIVVVFRDAFDGEESGTAGSCHHMKRNGRLYAEIRLKPAGSIRTEYRRAIHEFGHCLGLGHWTTGIMRLGDLEEHGQMEFDRFGDGQVKLMERTFSL